jgi:hypothetical protein
MDTKTKSFAVPECLQAIAAVEDDLDRLTADLTECQFQAPPRSGGWSIGYCIEHLTLTGNGFMDEWDAALETAAAQGLRADGPFPYSWFQRRLLSFAEPPYAVKVKTTRPFVPCARRSMADTVRRFLKMHAQMTSRVERSEGFDAARIRVKSPFLSWLSYSLGMSFDLAVAHERRHLWQAWQIRRQFTGQEKCGNDVSQDSSHGDRVISWRSDGSSPR